ncbi:uncharacterized protein BYT42DRAFT_183181 [Radiomyces spectabilis]|uniref:uncharacterized protein n=1 Tax=Radiomyces spectabilis TaxID=64574 RepID=UPI00221F69A5|nr:uncharacterized protein BYT42DRAFT_183181 [Radiomyces spectabilis]KAI8391138.1 hypothetical protein BYT42DRAFT_183181 [Radiomyces spectabilis]
MNKPGPPPYIPPPPPGTSQDQQATPHMPPTINPTPSLSSGVPGRYSSGPGRSPSPAGFVAPSSQSSHGYPPRPPMGYGTQRPDSSAAPLLSAPYNPQGVSPRPHSNGQYPHGDVYPPAHPYPPSNGQYGFPGPSSYPPPAQSNIGFPEPQHFNGNYAPRNDVVGTPFAAHQGIYPPVSSGGYPPANTYPPQQGYPPQPGYPPY